MTQPPYRTYRAYLHERYGTRVHRVSLDAGFGCPHRDAGRGAGGCIYCNQKGSGTGAWDRGLSVAEQMKQGITRLRKSGIERFTAYFQAFCNTDGPPERLRVIYEEALRDPGVVELALGARPDQVPDAALDLLADLQRHPPHGGALKVWLELGLQSAHDATLKRIRRGHDRAAFDDAARRAAERGLSVAAHLILGLPGETPAHMLATADYVAGLPLSGIKLHHLYLEKGTELSRTYDAHPFPLLTAQAYVGLAAEVLRRQPPDRVVLRAAGWCPPERTLCPRWGLAPGQVQQALVNRMKKGKMRQGDLYDPSNPRPFPG